MADQITEDLFSSPDQKAFVAKARSLGHILSMLHAHGALCPSVSEATHTEAMATLMALDSRASIYRSDIGVYFVWMPPSLHHEAWDELSRELVKHARHITATTESAQDLIARCLLRVARGEIALAILNSINDTSK